MVIGDVGWNCGLDTSPPTSKCESINERWLSAVRVRLKVASLEVKSFRDKRSFYFAYRPRYNLEISRNTLEH